MNTNSRDERTYLNNVGRIADATERIARVLEQHFAPWLTEDVSDTMRSMSHSARKDEMIERASHDD